MSEHPVVVIGFFDGVHRGHRALLDTARRFAADNGVGGNVVAVTFDTVPKIRGDLLCTPAERVHLLRRAGARDVRILAFRNVRRLGPAAFLDRCIRPLQPLSVTVGEGFRFGRDGSGGIAELRRWCARSGIVLLVVGEVRAAAGDGMHRVSASRIRALVRAGRFTDAAMLLGRPYELGGPVVPGQGIGRTLGVPTLNWHPATDVLQPRGVMAGRLVCARTVLPAVAYVGSRPTIPGGGGLVGEVHVIGRPPAGIRRVLFRPAALLRRDRRFGSVRELQRQMLRDIARARAVLRCRTAPHPVFPSGREAAPCR